MLFNFTLAPLDEIKSWGKPRHENLHWYGLTDSQYWIDVGAERLLEYSEAAWTRSGRRFCDYQVARLYEDVIGLAGFALDSVPPDLVPFIADQGRRKTLGCMSAWCAEHSERNDDQFWSVVDVGSTWIGKRELDTAYLSPSADIVMWSDESMVHVEWDNRDKLIEGVGAWTARSGKYSLTRSAFIEECRSLHERLMDAMSERVEQVVAGALSPAIHVDLLGLMREHEEHRHLSPLNFGALPEPTDWVAVREAMRTIGA